MKNDNKGFTLVELIVSVAILAIVLAAAFGFMIAGTRSYTTVQNKIELQLRAQLALNQISQYLIDANVGVKWNDAEHRLDVLDSGDSTVEGADCTDHVFSIVNGVLNYGSASVTPVITSAGGKKTITYTLAAAETDEVVPGADSFSVGLTPVSGSDPQRIMTAKIVLKLHKGKAVYEATKTVALRNRPPLIR